MDTMKRAVQLSFVLGVPSVIAVGISHLALTDIWHGENDVVAEWRAVQVSFGVIIAFQLSALITLWRIIRVVRN